MPPLQRSSEPLTVAPEHMDVQLLKEVHDERVDLWQQSHEEDDGEAESKDCRRTHKGTEGGQKHFNAAGYYDA